MAPHEDPLGGVAGHELARYEAHLSSIVLRCRRRQGSGTARLR